MKTFLKDCLPRLVPFLTFHSLLINSSLTSDFTTLLKSSSQAHHRALVHKSFESNWHLLMKPLKACHSFDNVSFQKHFSLFVLWKLYSATLLFPHQVKFIPCLIFSVYSYLLSINDIVISYSIISENEPSLQPQCKGTAYSCSLYIK